VKSIRFEILNNGPLFAQLVFICLGDSVSKQVYMALEEYNSLPTTQTTNRVPQNCWNYLTSTY